MEDTRQVRDEKRWNFKAGVVTMWLLPLSLSVFSVPSLCASLIVPSGPEFIGYLLCIFKPLSIPCPFSDCCHCKHGFHLLCSTFVFVSLTVIITRPFWSSLKEWVSWFYIASLHLGPNTKTWQNDLTKRTQQSTKVVCPVRVVGIQLENCPTGFGLWRHNMTQLFFLQYCWRRRCCWAAPTSLEEGSQSPSPEGCLLLRLSGCWGW